MSGGSVPRTLLHGLELVRRSAQKALATGFAAYILAREWVRAPDSGRRGREHLLRAFGRALVGLATQLGATLIKVGQIASTRGDLLAEPLRRELATLQDRVPLPVPRGPADDRVRARPAIRGDLRAARTLSRGGAGSPGSNGWACVRCVG